jgi:hypothetical protein
MQVLMAHDVWHLVGNYSAWQGRFRDASEGEIGLESREKPFQEWEMHKQQERAWGTLADFFETEFRLQVAQLKIPI